MPSSGLSGFSTAWPNDACQDAFSGRRWKCGYRPPQGGLVFFLRLDLLLVLRHGRPGHLVVRGRRLIDQVGGKIFVGLFRQQQPGLRKLDQVEFNVRIGDRLGSSETLLGVATVFICRHRYAPHCPIPDNERAQSVIRSRNLWNISGGYALRGGWRRMHYPPRLPTCLPGRPPERDVIRVHPDPGASRPRCFQTQVLPGPGASRPKSIGRKLGRVSRTCTTKVISFSAFSSPHMSGQSLAVLNVTASPDS